MPTNHPREAPRSRKRGHRQRSCIVIGGGLAGIAAALKLADAGWKVSVLEAQERLGGRVMSHRFREADKLVCELGAEWIGVDHHRLRKLCRRFKLKLDQHKYAYGFWDGQKTSPTYTTGSSFTKRAEHGYKAFEKAFKKFDHHDQAQMLELDQRDWWSALGQMGYSDDDQLQRDLMDSTDFGESIRLTSAYVAAAEYCRSNDTDECDAKVRGGNDRVFKEADKWLKHHGRVLKDRRVTHIHQGPDTVTVQTVSKHHARRSFTADFCVCTTPAHCLNRIKWRPALPRDQQNAAHQLQYSRIMKTAVLYANRFCKDVKRGRRRYGFSVFTGRASDFCFHSTFRQKGEFGILCSYAIGDKADDLSSEPNENNVMKWITEDVAAAVHPKPHVPIAPIKMRKQPWQREPWIGGAYAFYRPGQWFVVRPLLQRPFGRVSFAGEHVSEKWQGFMEGAVETGEEAAKRLIRFVEDD